MSGVMKTVGSSAHTKDEREKNDYYATDPQALIDLLDKMDEDGVVRNKRVWEPSCGEGNLVKVLQERDHIVLGTDLVGRGYAHEHDFLTTETGVWHGDILTNPPYIHAQEFVQKALDAIVEDNKVIMLFKLAFVESAKRHEFFKANPPKYIYVHSRRIGIWKSNIPKGGNALCYAWFVWEKGYVGETILRWIP